MATTPLPGSTDAYRVCLAGRSCGLPHTSLFFCITGERGGMQMAWTSACLVQEAARCAHGCISRGLCFCLPCRPETQRCRLPETRPFIHEKWPQLKKKPHAHRSVFFIQKEINSAYSSGTGKSHSGLSRLLLIACGENFIFAPFFGCFPGFPPTPSLGEPAQCCAVLCTDIPAGWKASTGPRRDRAVGKVMPKLEARLIS